MNIKIWTTGLAITVMGTGSVFAKDIFTAELQVDGVTQIIGYNKILNVADQYESENMRKIDLLRKSLLQVHPVYQCGN